MSNEHTQSQNNKRKRLLLIICIVIIATLFITIIFVHPIKENDNNQTIDKQDAKENSLIGLWTTDGITIYEFKENEMGVLKLPLSEYTFTYKIQGNKLYIDFESEKTTDSYYEYYIEEDKLILRGIRNTTGEYNFYKLNVK